MITQEYLKQIIDYDESTGNFTWKINANTRARIGQVAGGLRPDGYIVIGINKEEYLAHRLVYLYVYGSLPELYVDHKNCIRNDNRLSNLRLADTFQNSKNMLISKRNSSGFKGVSWDKAKEKWLAVTRLNGKHKFIGYFNTAQEASLAYQDFAKINHGEFYRPANS